MNHQQFFNAIESGKIDLVKAHVLDFVHLNFTNKEGATPLSFAIEHSQIEIAHLLIENFAEFDNYAVLGQTLMTEQYELFEFFLSKKASIFHKNATKGTNLLMLAGLKKIKPYIQYLIDKGIDINETNIEGYNVLDFTVAEYHDDDSFFQYLISLGAKPNIISRPNYHNTLSLAVQFSHNLSIIQYLIENYAFDFEEMKKNDENLIAIALENNVDFDILSYLFQKGIKVKTDTNYLYRIILDNINYYDKYEKKALFDKFDLLNNQGIQLTEKHINQLQQSVIASSLDEKSKYRLMLDLVSYFTNKHHYKISEKEVIYFLKQKSHPRVLAYATKKTLSSAFFTCLNKEDEELCTTLSKQKLSPDDSIERVLTYNPYNIIQLLLKTLEFKWKNQYCFSIVENDKLQVFEKIELLNLAISHGCNIHSTNNKNENLLFSTKELELIQFLIDKKVNYNKKNQENESVFLKLMQRDIINLNPFMIHYLASLEDIDMNEKNQENLSMLDNYLIKMFKKREDDLDMDVIKAFLLYDVAFNHKEAEQYYNDDRIEEILELQQVLKDKKMLEENLASGCEKKAIKI